MRSDYQERPGVRKKGLSKQEHQLLWDSHELLNETVHAQSKQIAKLQKEVEAHDPKDYEAEIAQLEADIDRIQKEGTGAGLLERLRGSRLVSPFSHITLL